MHFGSGFLPKSYAKLGNNIENTKKIGKKRKIIICNLFRCTMNICRYD